MDRRLSDSPTVCALALHSCKFSVALFWFLLFGFTLSARSQEATIVGTVTDPPGSVVPNVKVSLTHVETGEILTVVTSDTGQYVAGDHPIRHYNVSAQAAGFKSAQHKRCDVERCRISTMKLRVSLRASYPSIPTIPRHRHIWAISR